MVKSRLSIVFLLTGLLALSSCTFRRIAIERADWVMLMQIDACFDLSWKQESALKPQIKSLIADMRAKSIPKAVSLLRQTADEISKPYDEKIVSNLLDEVWKIRSEALMGGINFAASNLKQLSAEQLQHCQQDLQDKDKKIYKLLTDNDETFNEGYFKHFIKPRISNVRKLFGKLTTAQEEMLEKMNSSTKLATTDRLAIKRKYQSAFFNAVQTLRQEELAKVMASWIQDSRTMLDSNSQTELSTVWQHSFKEKVSVFMPTLSVEQKEYFKEELLALAKDLERL